MDKNEVLSDLEDKIFEADGKKKISCRVLLDYAEKKGYPAGNIGKIIDEAGIKVSNCQLGCFK